MVSDRLRFWFVFHFVADMLFAVPLFIAPVWLLSIYGWQTVDPIASRIVAAGLFGIGIESLLGRNASEETFKAMLNLKLIWSSTVILGIILSLISMGGGPFMVWVILAIFLAFFFLWAFYRFQLR